MDEKEDFMVNKDSIDAALAAHSQWKKRLQDAIATHRSEFDPAVVKRDNACQFGQWLHGLPPQDKVSEDFKRVRDLHAEFHKVTGEILELALSGRKDDALHQLEAGGSYGSASGKLVLALQGWKAKL